MANQTNSGSKRILVADDEPSVIYSIKRILAGNHTVIEASDGEQAVVLAQSQKPDLILMDMMMPKKDGLTACAEIRANPQTHAIPIIMLTGVGHELNIKLAGIWGVNKYITKPFKPQDLLDAINSV